MAQASNDTSRQRRLKFMALFTLGLALFWPLFRHATFFMVLYPMQSASLPGNLSVAAHSLALLCLAVLTFAGLLLHERLNRLVIRPSFSLISGLLGSCAVVFAQGVTAGVLTPAFLWASAILAACGIIGLYTSWAQQCCMTFNCTTVALIGLSFFLSYLLFSRGALLENCIGPNAMAFTMPLGSAVCCTMLSLNATRCGLANETYGHDDKPHSRQIISLPALMIAAFLVIGAAVRGIVDVQAVNTGARYPLSLVLAGLLSVACFSYAWMTGLNKGTTPESVKLERFALECWMVLALVFLGGLFSFFVLDNQIGGGDVVVISRTMLEFVLWLLLCGMAHYRNLSAVWVSLTYGMTATVVSWFLSYVVIPNTVAFDGQGVLSPAAFVLVVIFAVVTAMLLCFGAYLIANSPTQANTANIGQQEAVGDSRSIKLVPNFNLALLTQREHDVAQLYTRGYSLGKVADELGITKSTAQSHIKNVYRKLDIHSRDDLIERMGNT